MGRSFGGFVQRNSLTRERLRQRPGAARRRARAGGRLAGRDAGRRLPADLAVGEAQRAVARGGEERVAGTVVLEVAARLVEAPGVRLDRESRGREQEVHLEALDLG